MKQVIINMSAEITNKQKEIVFLVYRFRFLNREQIQKLLYHKNHKRILAWLSGLVALEYLGRKYDKDAGRNKIPGIYYLEKRGKQYIASLGVSTKYTEKIKREEKISFITQDHSLMIADFYLLLRDHFENEQKEFSFFTKADLAKDFPSTIIKPDAYLMYEDDISCFLEFDRETETRVTMRKKLEKYIHYYKTKKWQDFSRHYFPCIIIVSLSKQRSRILISEIEQLLIRYKTPPLIFKFTTLEKIQIKEPDAEICLVPFKGNEQFRLI